MDGAWLMLTTEFGHSCLNSKCHFHDRERQKSSVRSWFNWWSVCAERKGTVGQSLGCPPWLCFVLQPGKDVEGLSHKKVILRYLNIWAALSLRAGFVFKGCWTPCVIVGFRWYLPRHIQVFQQVLEFGLPFSSSFFYWVLRGFVWDTEIPFFQTGSCCVCRGGWVHLQREDLMPMPSSIKICVKWTQGSLNSPNLWFVWLNDGDSLGLLWRGEGNV